jgi:hypothetical protein
LREVRGPDFATVGLRFPCVGQAFGGGSARFRLIERQADYAMQESVLLRSMCQLQPDTPRPVAVFCNVVTETS